MRAAVLLLALAACPRDPPPAPAPPPAAERAPPPPEAMPAARGACTSDGDCRPTGCSGTLCATEDVISTCEWRPEYACYRPPTTSCGCFEGRCSWAPTEALRACLQEHAP